MKGHGAETPVVAGREHQWESLRALILELGEARDLKGLAAVADMSLSQLRQLCQRPSTCEDLGEMLERLRELKLDAYEAGEE